MAGLPQRIDLSDAQTEQKTEEFDDGDLHIVKNTFFDDVVIEQYSGETYVITGPGGSRLEVSNLDGGNCIIGAFQEDAASWNYQTRWQSEQFRGMLKWVLDHVEAHHLDLKSAYKTPDQVREMLQQY